MANELIPLSDVQSRLREKVQQAMLDLIPPEAFDKYVEEAWRTFTEGTPEKKNQYGNVSVEAKPAAIVRMLRDVMEKELKLKVASWAAEWAQGEKAEEAAKRVLAECTKIASASFVDRVVGSSIKSAVEALTPGLSVNCGSCGNRAFPMSNCGNCGSWNG